jgi:membrane protease YdiL (CAAX protease family)
VDPHVKAIIALFVGVLAAIVAVAKLLPPDSSTLTVSLVASAAFVLVGLAGAWILRPGGLRRSLAGPPSVASLPLGIVAGALAFAFSFGYVEGLVSLFGLPGFAILPRAPSLELVLAVAVLPALVEEWTDRGVLWAAMRPLVSQRTTIVATAIVFAFMHGLQGMWLLGLPHRFVAGLVFGWLRARTGSLVPCMLAHFVHNGLALWL